MSESLWWLLRDARKARKQGPTGLQRRQRARFAEMVAFARARSPYYRELYRHLPEHIEDAKSLPVTDKKKLMARFDDWVTDREVDDREDARFRRQPRPDRGAVLGQVHGGHHLGARVGPVESS